MKPVIVLGPHRSGTSVTTRVVSLLGLSLCVEEDRLIQWDNPTGHWESRSLMGLNEELLGRFEGFWHAPPELPAEWWSSPELEDFRRRAAGRFHEVHSTADWVWKDPRLCLTLPFWTAALETDPICVVTHRHPSEAADSMANRDGWGPRHALALLLLKLTGGLQGAQARLIKGAPAREAVRFIRGLVVARLAPAQVGRRVEEDRLLKLQLRRALNA